MLPHSRYSGNACKLITLRNTKLKHAGMSEPALKPKPNKTYIEKRRYPVPMQEKENETFCSKLANTVG